MKQLHVPNREDYLEEVGVFDKLGLASKDSMTSHLVPLQLTYKHGRDYFLIFPWADGNLKQFWKKQRSNPRSQSMVCWFFHQCWGISRGLRKIHHLGTQIKNSSGANMLDAKDLSKMVLNTVAVDRLWGRHGDIKPENILWFKDYEGKPNHLVISDFGLTRFNSAQSKSRVHHEQIQGFSGTYRPPDMHLDETISQKYDVWSLGCVFLEFISWLLLGSKAVDDFARARTKDEAEKQTEATEDKFFGIVGPVQGKQYPILKESVVKVSDLEALALYRRLLKLSPGLVLTVITASSGLISCTSQRVVRSLSIASSTSSNTRCYYQSPRSAGGAKRSAIS